MSRLPSPGGDDGQWGDILNDYLTNSVVHTSGSETVGGTKTFSSSPVVPTPTSDGQAATKAYVDSSSSTPSGSAGGDLSGSYPNPTVAKVNGVTVSGTAASGKTLLATSASAASWSNIAQSDVTNLTTDLAAKAADSAVVHNTGTETVAGAKTFSSELSTVDLSVSGITGAANASRYVGATTTGAPSSGTFSTGDYIIDRTGELWICSSGGSPGTWQIAGSGTELGFAANTSSSSPTFTTVADLSGVTITFTVGSRPVYVHAYAPLVANDTSGAQSLFLVTDGSNTETGRNLHYSSTANGGFSPNIWERISTPGTYTRKVRASRNTGGGTTTVYTVLAGGAWIRAVTA